jgi:hypothetical protein
MKDVFEVLKQKEAELARLQQEVEALRIASRLLADRTERRRPPGAALSQPEMIREVLLEHGGPMHVSAIAEAIQKKYGKEIATHYITAMIYRYIKRGKTFQKAEQPNTFGLLEWPAAHETQMNLPTEKIAPDVLQHSPARNTRP